MLVQELRFSLRRHVDDLSVDELEPAVLDQQAHRLHAQHVVAREAVSGRLFRGWANLNVHAAMLSQPAAALDILAAKQCWRGAP